MKKLFPVLVFLFIFIGMIQAKPFLNMSEAGGPKLFYFGSGLSIGGFYPSNINDYMSDYFGNVDPAFGTFDMMMYFGVNFTGTFFFTPYTELQIDVEWVASPKFIMVNDEMQYFALRRLTPGLKFNAHIPLGSKVSYFIGPGISFSYLNFKTPEESYSALAPGFSAQTGVMIRFGKIALQPGFTFNFIKADTDDGQNPNDFYGGGIDELSYTGVQIGCKVLF